MCALGCVFAGAIAVLSGEQQVTDPFSGQRAWQHLEAITAIGPRPAGSAGIERTRDYIKAELARLNVSVQSQTFQPQTPGGRVAMVNLVATIPGTSSSRERIIVMGHYDTKPFKDIRFVGANDGGSSAAFLLEFARFLKQHPRSVTYEVLFLDGEEAFCLNWDDCKTATGPDNTYGSRHYVSEVTRAGSAKTIKAAILVDMIAERGAIFRRESLSTTWLKDIIWSAARNTRYRQYFSDSESEVQDDHIWFLRAGIPAVDIIDIEYPSWHTANDLLDKLSAESLSAVGTVLIAALPQIEARRVN
jgi:Zn-dependent M28 family amino/carboxypeptidase